MRFFMVITDALALADAAGFFHLSSCLLWDRLANFFVCLFFTLILFCNIKFDASLDTY